MVDVLRQIAFSAVSFLVVLGLVVTVHEMGHFLVAKWLGTAIDRFSIGFGRPLVEWRDRSGVEWRIGWIPLGGYVKFSGDENEASTVPDEEDLEIMRRRLVAREGEAALSRYYHFKPPWQRAAISVAGPLANFLLAIAIFTALLMALGEPISPARVDGVTAGSPAQRAGFQPGDVVLRANGHHIKGFEQLRMISLLHTGTPVDFVVARAGREVPITATPERGTTLDAFGHPHRMGLLGIQYQGRPGDLHIQRYNLPQAVAEAGYRCWDRVATTVEYLGRVISGRESADQLAGPIGMARLSGDVAKQVVDASPNGSMLALNALVSFLDLAANISVGIGFLNLLPIPVLDGGHLLFYGYEAVARRPLAAKVQAVGYRVGLALVLGLFLFATWNDLNGLRVFNLFGRLFS